MIKIIGLDSGPLGLVTHPKIPPPPSVASALQWINEWSRAGCRFIVPAVADFEVRRELVRAGKFDGVASLDTFNHAQPDRYLPLTDSALKRGADLWAQARNRGVLPADPKELNADVLIAAQMQEYAYINGLTDVEIVIATVNVGHLALFVPAKAWTEIQP